MYSTSSSGPKKNPYQNGWSWPLTKTTPNYQDELDSAFDRIIEERTRFFRISPPDELLPTALHGENRIDLRRKLSQAVARYFTEGTNRQKLAQAFCKRKEVQYEDRSLPNEFTLQFKVDRKDETLIKELIRELLEEELKGIIADSLVSPSISANTAEQRLLHLTSAKKQIQQIYEKSNDCFFVKANKNEQDWLIRQKLPNGLFFQKKQPADVEAKLGFRLRAASLVDGLLFALEAKWGAEGSVEELDRLSKKIMQMLYDFAATINQQTDLGNPAGYQNFCNNHLTAFSSKLFKFAVEDLKVEEKEAAETLLHFEFLACWRKQSTDKVAQAGFATVTKSRAADFQFVQITRPANIPLTEEQKAELEQIKSPTKLPQWFLALPPLAQQWWKQNLDQILQWGCPPSVMRTIPGCANFRKDETYITDGNGKVLANTAAHRMAVITAVDIGDTEERNRITRQNAAQVKQALMSGGFLPGIYGEAMAQKFLSLPVFVLDQRQLTPLIAADR